MNPKQFDALSQLLRLRPGSTHAVCRAVLVDGLSVADAARKVGVGYVPAYKAVQRARKGLELVQRVTG